MPAGGNSVSGGNRALAKGSARRLAVEIGGAAGASCGSGSGSRRGRSVCGGTSGSGDGSTGGSDDVSGRSTSHAFTAEHDDRMTRGLKISPNNRFPGQASSMSSHIGTANKIVKEKLTPKQLDLFKRTVFGRFVDMDLVFSSPLVHHILLREVKDERPDAMSFNLNGIIATFSKEEFLLVTGLWPSPTKSVRRVEASKSLGTKYFGNELVVDMNPITFEERYKNLNFYDDLDAVKVTLVYYTELAMMGKDRTKSIINKSLLDDVEDLKYYNSLDWGHILWERTLRGLQNALKNKVDMYKKKVKLNKNYNVKYSLPGFPHAFQVWAYEIISSMAAGRAVTRLNNDAVPRFLRWSCSYSLPSKLLQRDIFNSTRIVISPALVMSDAEKQFRDTQVDERPVYVADQAERAPSVIDISEESDGPKDAQGQFDDHDLHNEDISNPHYKHLQGPHAKHERSDNCDPHDNHDIDNNSVRFMRDHVEDHLPEPEMSMKRCKREGKSREEHKHNVFSHLKSLDGRISRVEDTLKEMKSDLQTITSLLRSYCKSKNVFNDKNGACELDSRHPEPTSPTAPSPHIETTTTSGLDDERAIRTAECEVVQDMELRKWGFKFTLA
ncbi:uncharacterized protein LOC103482899 isoform X3 [Cucumis melo]|uniref:Uncharacterized protein LOC103482899 isoform X3 n=1 Tax=Cucumis melo TaxID=3656 RepID=A0A1S3AUB0_CUCME|nr:uncharacterized protein LOC103482899 isoform X3 [Cucumis melo]